MNSPENSESQQVQNALDKQTELLQTLIEESKAIEQRLVYFNEHKFVQAYNSIPKLLWFQLLKGMALGLGTVLGAGAVLSGLVYLLSQIEFIPIIGEWVTAILDVIKQPT